MLDANSPTFRQQYPNGAIVRDRLGRRLSGVQAFNLETGEVIAFVPFAPAALWHRLRWWWAITRGSIRIDGPLLNIDASLARRHGFYPAPLTIEPRQWLHIGFVKE